LGWTLLQDQAVELTRGTGRIELIGAHNWGRFGTVRPGNFDHALGAGQTATDRFTILLSHDPSAWDARIRPHERRFDLTLAGHTHGMQMGVRLGSWEWSPIALVYNRWAGLYTEQHERLYVNRGFGFILLPSRVGVPPEITVITLRKGSARA
jgi:hypothetical protein